MGVWADKVSVIPPILMRKALSFFNYSIVIFLLAVIPVSAFGAVLATEVQFPTDAPVWNVRDYGAKGDGVSDDTQAFQAAIASALDAPGRYGRGGASQIVYVPNGTYKITDTLQNIIPNNGKPIWHEGFYLQGQSEAGAVLLLPNSCPGFTDPAKPKPVIQTKSQNGAVDAAFRHYVRNLTVDIGTGNSGAIGIDFLANNRGGLYHVTIQSSDPNKIGVSGVAMDARYPGPALLKYVTIRGFNTGISMNNVSEYGMTFEHITLQDQLETGVYLGANSAVIRELNSTNSVPVVTNIRGHLVILNGTFTGGVATATAIDMRGAGQIYCRNITSSGYGSVINENGGKNVPGNGAIPVTIAEYVSSGPYKAFPNNSDTSLNLPVKETPDFNSLDMTQWANAAPTKGLPDCLSSIQAAIDSGKPIVYLPSGTYSISNTIILRGSVKKFIGLCAVLLPTHDFPKNAPLIQFDGGTEDFTIIQDIALVGNAVDSHEKIATGIMNNSAKTLVISNCDVETYDNTATGVGDLFLENTIGPILNIDFPQHVWARQLNIEGSSGAHITNNGGTLWLLGYKTEGSHPAVEGNLHTLLVNNGGTVELTGGFFYPTGKFAPTVPMIINKEGSISLNYKKDDVTSLNYPVQIEDIESGVTVDYPATSLPGGNDCPLYSGHH